MQLFREEALGFGVDEGRVGGERFGSKAVFDLAVSSLTWEEAMNSRISFAA